MTKKFSFFTVMFMLVAVMSLSACSESGGANGSEELAVWVAPFASKEKVEEEDEMWNSVIASFNEEYPNVDVALRKIPWDNRDQKILTGISSGDGPDLIYIIADAIPRYVEEEMIVPLDKYLDDMDMDDFEQSSLTPAMYNDQQYGIPLLQEAYVNFYDVDLVEEIGKDPDNLPETWDEFEEWAKAAKDKGLYIQDYAGGSSLRQQFYPLVWQAGSDVLNEDGEVTINDAGGLEAFKRINEMYENSWVPEGSINRIKENNELTQENIVSTLGSGVTLSILQESDINFKIGPPLKKEGDPVTYGNTGMLAVTSTSDNQEIAAEFAKNMVEEENQKQFNETTMYIPPLKSAQSIHDNDEYLSEITSYMQYARSGVKHPSNNEIMEQIRPEIQAMLGGDKTPKEAADNAAEKIRKIVDNN